MENLQRPYDEADVGQACAEAKQAVGDEEALEGWVEPKGRRGCGLGLPLTPPLSRRERGQTWALSSESCSQSEEQCDGKRDRNGEAGPHSARHPHSFEEQTAERGSDHDRDTPQDRLDGEADDSP